MSFSITLYRFNKKTNSDARPGSGVASLTISDVRIKSATSLINPILILNSDNQSVPTYNYCYIPKFNRYYFVGDIVYNPPTWNFFLTLDALATYRDQIIDSTQFIDRSSHPTAINEDVIDTMYPTTTNTLSTTTYTGFTDLVQTWEGGAFVVGVINGQTRANGSVNYYCMTHLELSQLANAMMGGSTYLNITDVSEDMVKILFDPFQYIVSCTWFPIARGRMPINTTGTELRFGWWNSGVNTYALDNVGVFTISDYMSITKHPQIDQTVNGVTYHFNYLQNNPYSEYTLTYGPFGEIPIDASKLYGKSNLYIWVTIDLISGLGKLYLSAENDITKAFKIVRANCGTDVQLSKVGPTVLNDIGTTIQSAAESVNSLFGSGATGLTAGSANMMHKGSSETAAIIANALGIGQNEAPATGGNFSVGGLIQTGLETVGTMVATSVASKFPGMQSIGSTGSVLEWARPPIVQNRFYNITGIDILHRGCPACKRLSIRAYPGYYQINMPEIEIPTSMTAERELIAAHMRAGFYHE